MEAPLALAALAARVGLAAAGAGRAWAEGACPFLYTQLGPCVTRSERLPANDCRQD
jgi:hypothetical protein